MPAIPDLPCGKTGHYITIFQELTGKFEKRLGTLIITMILPGGDSYVSAPAIDVCKKDCAIAQSSDR